MRRKLRSALLCCMVLTMLTGCATEGKNQKTTELKIGTLAVADSFALYVAQQEGLFKEHGVEVELIEFGSASNQSTAYEADEIDGMMTDMVVQTLINKNDDEAHLKVVAHALGSNATEGRFLVVAGPDSDIYEPQDLEGRTIGISENTMMQYLVECYLKELNVDRSTVTFVNVPNLSLRLDSVIEGSDIDAAILPDPLAMEAEARGCHVVIDDTQLTGNYSQSVIALKDRLMEEDPEAVANFLAAYNEAIEKLNSHPEDYEALFREKVAVSEALLEQYQIPSFTPDSVPEPAEVEGVLSWMRKNELIIEDYDYEEIVYVGK